MGILETFSLKNRTAVVTGGAGLFGRQIVEALAEAGARTFMASRKVSALEQEAVKLRDRKLDVTALSFDQGDEASIEHLLATVIEHAGGVDVLVNNAVLRPMADFDSPAADFDQSMHVNATGVFMMTRTFGRHMAAHKRGSIINVASIQGMVGPDFSLYEDTAMSARPDYFFHKGGMLQLTRFAAAVFGPAGVRVNAISPGGFYDGQEQRFVERYNERTLLGRMADESDLKGAIVFLASDASRYVTGVNLPIDGGYTAK